MPRCPACNSDVFSHERSYPLWAFKSTELDTPVQQQPQTGVIATTKMRFLVEELLAVLTETNDKTVVFAHLTVRASCYWRFLPA